MKKDREWSAMGYIESQIFHKRSMFWAEMAIIAAYNEGQGNQHSLINEFPGELSTSHIITQKKVS